MAKYKRGDRVEVKISGFKYVGRIESTDYYTIFIQFPSMRRWNSYTRVWEQQKTIIYRPKNSKAVRKIGSRAKPIIKVVKEIKQVETRMGSIE